MRALVLCASVLTLSTGCEFTGINDIPMPLSKGSGDDALQITVELENATNLVPNSEVRYDEVVVGSVRRIEFDDWTAKLTVGIEHDARIPADVEAKVAQKSLLGAEYLELSSPGRPSGDLLVDGAVIGLDRSGRYPETEEVLSAAALLLNNGGLPQLRTIAHELNQALNGHTDDVRSLVRQVAVFTRELDGQREQIAGALEALDSLSATVAGQRDAIGRALERLPKGIAALTHERKSFTRALSSLDRFSRVADRVFNRNEDGLVANLRNLRPVTKQLADHADELVETVDAISFPFPIRSINKAFFGDYINFFAELNIDLEKTAGYWTGGTALEDLVSTLLGVPPTSTGADDPLSSLPEEGPGPADQPDHRSGGDDARRTSDVRPGSPTDDVPPSSLMDGLLGGVMGGGGS